MEDRTIKDNKNKRKKSKERKIFYYSTERDDFVSLKGDAPHIGAEYKYLRRGALAAMKYFFFYRVFATPLAFLYSRLKLKERYVGRGRLRVYLRNARRTGSVGAFLVGNHTQPAGDAFTPNLLAFPTRNYTVIHPSNMNMPVLGLALPYMGGLPTPSDLGGARGFSQAVAECIKGGKTVAVYPEAHVWPYYTGVRAIDPAALHGAVRLGAPVFTFTRVYEGRRFGLGCCVYVDGPFYPDDQLSTKEAAEHLSERVYAVMRKRAEGSQDTGYVYLKRDGSDTAEQ